MDKEINELKTELVNKLVKNNDEIDKPIDVQYEFYKKNNSNEFQNLNRSFSELMGYYEQHKAINDYKMEKETAEEIEKLDKEILSEKYELSEDEENVCKDEIKYDEFDNFHMIEIYTVKKALQKQMKEMLDAKQSVMQYKSMSKFIKSLEETVKGFAKEMDENSKAEIDDIFDTEKMEADFEKFRNEFSLDFAKVKYKISLCDNALSKFDNPDSLKFITEELLYTFEKNETLFNKMHEAGRLTDKEYNKKIKANDICKNAINNRFDLTYVKSKFNKNNKSFKDFIKKSIKLESDKKRSRTLRILGSNLTEPQFNAITEFLNQTFNDKLFTETLMDYSANMIKSGLSTGHFSYWKMLIGNLAAKVTDNFDMDDCNPEDYMNEICSLRTEFNEVYSNL